MPCPHAHATPTPRARPACPRSRRAARPPQGAKPVSLGLLSAIGHARERVDRPRLGLSPTERSKCSGGSA
eukprot:2093195-Prymnesium_polylepis.1